MGEHKESILVWCLGVQIFVAVILGGFFGSAVTAGGIAIQQTLPSSPWGLISDALEFWWASISFQIPGGGYIAGVFFWFLALVELLMFVLIIRGD